ncbi:MAG: hypothetical protein ACP5LG_07745 [Conexivisphaera sp.]
MCEVQVHSIYVPVVYERCGLTTRAIEALNDLPNCLSTQVGKSIEFWCQEIDDAHSKLYEMGLLQGALDYLEGMAEARSARSNDDVCSILRGLLMKDAICNWISGYVRSLLSQYYGL